METGERGGRQRLLLRTIWDSESLENVLNFRKAFPLNRDSVTSVIKMVQFNHQLSELFEPPPIFQCSNHLQPFTAFRHRLKVICHLKVDLKRPAFTRNLRSRRNLKSRRSALARPYKSFD